MIIVINFVSSLTPSIYKECQVMAKLKHTNRKLAVLGAILILLVIFIVGLIIGIILVQAKMTKINIE